MVIRPTGYAIWERMQAEMDARIKAAGAENAYFPLFIPESYLKREAEHVEGFSPELAVVTHGGGKQLAEPVVVRPTSETVIGEFMAKWVDSYRDLPLLLNQWANVVRWELRPRIFLRTSEFLWQEGHTAHATEDDARGVRAARSCTRCTRTSWSTCSASRWWSGARPTRERFAGATSTYTLEGMMGDGKALQMGTCARAGPELRQGVRHRVLRRPRAASEHAWTTSWGTSTRMLGGLIMAHGDDNGLRVPPRLAPIQAYVMVVKDGEGVAAAAAKLRDALRDAGVRVGFDDRVDTAFGRRAVDAELKGYPVRVEVGPRDLAAGNVVVVRRVDGSKTPVAGRPTWSAGCSPRSTPTSRRCYDEALALPRVAHRRGRHAGRGDRGGGDRLGPGAVVGGRRRGRGQGQRQRRHRALPDPGRRLGARLRGRAGPGRDPGALLLMSFRTRRSGASSPLRR